MPNCFTWQCGLRVSGVRPGFVKELFLTSHPATFVVVSFRHDYANLFFPLILSVVLLFIHAAYADPQTEPVPSSSIVLHAARLLEIDTGKIITPGEVLVKGNHIAEVGSSVKRPAGAHIST